MNTTESDKWKVVPTEIVQVDDVGTEPDSKKTFILSTPIRVLCNPDTFKMLRIHPIFISAYTAESSTERDEYLYVQISMEMK